MEIIIEMTRLLPLFFVATIAIGCIDSAATSDKTDSAVKMDERKEPIAERKHFAGAFSNGMKGDSISFDISADGKKLENLTFKGYWRCNGKLESVFVGPDDAFVLVDNKVNDHISEPPDGGSTAWRFDLNAAINGNEASGTFRMNINNLGCNTGTLSWTAKKVDWVQSKGKL